MRKAETLWLLLHGEAKICVTGLNSLTRDFSLVIS